MKKALIALGLCHACTLALAQPAQPAARVSREASFVCGGVSQEDQQAIKAQARQHDLMLTFAISNGAYLADVDVEIRDSRGAVVLNAKCDGPIMLVDLPSSGSWRVSAQANGQTKQKTIATRHGRPSQTTFVWPANQS